MADSKETLPTFSEGLQVGWSQKRSIDLLASHGEKKRKIS